MRFSQMLIPTLREAPTDAEVISHQLMMRAGMIRKVAAGVYSYLPLGLRVINKISNIIREEMNRAGAQELQLPVVIPSELWKESGRWEAYGKELLRFVDRHDRSFCMGPTHEEVITDLVRKAVNSYRQLPLNLYQIQTKFRDEVRPRFGLMRGREFLMKDGYSFDVNEERSLETYKKMYEAYRKIFSRCGLDFRPVEATTGAIGGNYSHEFQVLAASGEDAIVSCNRCEYAANIEKAETRKDPSLKDWETPSPQNKFKEVQTPHAKTIEEVSAFLKMDSNRLVKTLLFETDSGPVAALVRGDYDLNEEKLKNAIGAEWIRLADEKTVEKTTGGPSGFSGPIGLQIPIYGDFSLVGMKDFVVGANKKDCHLIEVNLGDFPLQKMMDLRKAKKGDLCPRCDGMFDEFRGIEVGQVFYLGTKYSKSMKAVFLDEKGQENLMVMGCYGIGVGRTAAAAIEQQHDENGITWPYSIAPFQFQIIPLNIKDEKVREVSERLYSQLSENGFDVLMDERDESAGVKFKDADLIGIPYRLVIGAKGLAEGKVEFKERKTGKVWKVSVEDALEEVKKIHREA
ncbi:MAG: proline--tRNA ligase [bacterium]